MSNLFERIRRRETGDQQHLRDRWRTEHLFNVAREDADDLTEPQRSLGDAISRTYGASKEESEALGRVIHRRIVRALDEGEVIAFLRADESGRIEIRALDIRLELDKPGEPTDDVKRTKGRRWRI